MNIPSYSSYFKKYKYILVRDHLITNQYDEIYTIVGPVLAAMITVNIIIVIYVYRAYQVRLLLVLQPQIRH